MTTKIRIKDIALKAGVSVGTVDRVLHDRPNVSKPARAKVEKALDEMNYQPNMYASALAYNKSYTFYLLIPRHDSEAYWEEIEEGARKAVEARRDFHIDIKIEYYQRLDADSFSRQGEKCLTCHPDGLIIVPTDIEVTRKLTDKLHELQTPFVFLDSNIPDLLPLSYFGQDSFSSGLFAAKIMMLAAHGDKQVAIVRQMKDGRMNSQQANRERGFRHYMHDHYPDVNIVELDIPLSAKRSEYDKMLETFFSTHPLVHHCITMNSKAHIVGNFLLKTKRRNVQIMGYDMVAKNVMCLRRGSISFLIAQHAYQQGFCCVDTLFKAIVLKKKVNPINYMPIELLTNENVDFYKRTQL